LVAVGVGAVSGVFVAACASPIIRSAVASAEASDSFIGKGLEVESAAKCDARSASVIDQDRQTSLREFIPIAFEAGEESVIAAVGVYLGAESTHVRPAGVLFLLSSRLLRERDRADAQEKEAQGGLTK